MERSVCSEHASGQAWACRVGPLGRSAKWIVLGWPSGELTGEGCFLQSLLPSPPQPPWFPEAPSCNLILQACPQWTEMQSG